MPANAVLKRNNKPKRDAAVYFLWHLFIETAKIFRCPVIGLGLWRSKASFKGTIHLLVATVGNQSIEPTSQPSLSQH